MTTFILAHYTGHLRGGFSRRPAVREQHIRRALNESEVGQLPQQTLGEAGLKAKIKGFQRFEIAQWWHIYGAVDAQGNRGLASDNWARLCFS